MTNRKIVEETEEKKEMKLDKEKLSAKWVPTDTNRHLQSSDNAIRTRHGKLFWKISRWTLGFITLI